MAGKKTEGESMGGYKYHSTLPIEHDSDQHNFIRDIGSSSSGIARLMRDKKSVERVAIKYIKQCIQKMDSQESGNNSSAQHPWNYTMPAQILNGVHPMNFPFQQVLHFDPTNRNYHLHADQQPRIHLDPINGFSFQSLLNAPMCNTQTRDATKERKKREKDTQNHTNSQSSIAKKDWSKEEEIALTKAWLYVSEDAEVGNNQKGAAMWDRILEAWKGNMGVTCITARNNNSLQLKWSKIQFAVSKFHAQYERLERHPQSGSNSDDLVRNSLWIP
ncbi:serine/threonine-protein kinase SAPK8 [Striga asiatica]|uniref:Serine/threonine-protein kinase SAPK8 n=1 Tax=Striga asiatica TaxID=4170 RepID=A0A5A7RFF4_STRAF|nr:serine/threonine-protein kinase SAPK8 [Striga asiatica]